jgi:predicted amidohydrolase YtcJ
MLMEQRADVMFAGGRIWTGVERRGPLDTVAVRNGRIVGIGSLTDLAWARGPRTRVIPLAGRLLVPAFGDAHVHPLAAGLAMTQCWLHDAPEDAAAYQAVIGEYAAGHPDRPWIIGEGWVVNAFPGGLPTAELLDAIVPDRPVYLESADGYAAWVNGAALALAGIDDGTPDPRTGRIARYTDGAALGTLQGAAMELVRALTPTISAAEREDGLRRGQAALQRVGIGSWQDANVGPDDEVAYVALAGRGELTGRAALALRWEPHRGMEQLSELLARQQALAEWGGGRLSAPTVKLFQDGVAEDGTAAMIDPYLGEDGGPGRDRGDSRYHPVALRDICVALDDARFAVHAHAIGDRAVREVLDALTAARKVNGPRDSRHQIAHLQFIDPADISRFRALGVIANCQPYWAAHGAYVDDLAGPLVGAERLERMYPFGSLARQGATLALGSDWSVSTPDPMRILEVATRRVDPDVRHQPPLGPPSERLSNELAMRAFTRGSAYANGFEDVTGIIHEGRPADLVLLDRDPMTTPGVSFGDARALLTMVDGRIVWEDPGLGA